MKKTSEMTLMELFEELKQDVFLKDKYILSYDNYNRGWCMRGSSEVSSNSFNYDQDLQTLLKYMVESYRHKDFTFKDWNKDHEEGEGY